MQYFFIRALTAFRAAADILRRLRVPARCPRLRPLPRPAPPTPENALVIAAISGPEFHNPRCRPVPRKVI
ncbi:MAG: hypothetical protein AUI36_45935 [Cyanobacteria bacterium 13_1_40CM_2_61_4]|nr:MAG: hypothetical protein AUI36_45935 [Cyanobacteria bacterium 13_1_40CM_2_61_4]